MARLEVKRIETDVLIVGGGTAGCYAALTLSRESELSVLVVEKAHIKRSGCLAAGVNAINAYINPGQTVQDYVDYAEKDAAGIVRHDLLRTAAERFNEVTKDLERLGLVILKDENGAYVARGKRNIKINGENIKPILAAAVESAERVETLNHVNVTDLLLDGGRACGAVGFSVLEEQAYVFTARAVLIATGGAAGLYRPNNPGHSRHKMWYPPFNTGAGYAMGIRAGAEMTSLEMRFIALRCKDTIAPTGTIAQGVGAAQVNARGEVYETRYGLTTSERVYGTVAENRRGNGPCYLRTSGITREQGDDLLRAYLNMAPSQTLRWIESGKRPEEQDVEIEGTEPYVVGGHTASGYWVDTKRETTIPGLYAAGDVAGGCPQKYVTGALAEGEIAARSIIERLSGSTTHGGDGTVAPGHGPQAADSGWTAGGHGEGARTEQAEESLRMQISDILDGYQKHMDRRGATYTIEDVEEAMQKVMDQYAGGIATGYAYNEKQLALAEEKIMQLSALADGLGAGSMHELLFVCEVKERLTVCRALIAHLRARKETRWHTFGENADYPERDEAYFGYVNSRMAEGRVETRLREIVTEESYEHQNRS